MFDSISKTFFKAAENDLCNLVEKHADISQKNYKNLLEEFENIFYLYMKELNYRPGIIDNIIRSPFDAYTLYRQWKDHDKKRHTPKFIDKKFRACQDRTEDIQDRFYKALERADTELVDVQIRLNSLVDDSSGIPREMPGQHVWVEVDFVILYIERKILKAKQITWKYDAWVWKMWLSAPEKVGTETLWKKDCRIKP